MFSASIRACISPRLSSILLPRHITNTFLYLHQAVLIHVPKRFAQSRIAPLPPSQALNSVLNIEDHYLRYAPLAMTSMAPDRLAKVGAYRELKVLASSLALGSVGLASCAAYAAYVCRCSTQATK